MSSGIDQTSSSTSGRKPRWLWALVAVVVLALVATSAFLLGRSESGVHEAAPSPNNPSAPSPVAPVAPVYQGPLGRLEWTEFAGTPLPRSAKHGPREDVGGVARGYSHDEAGAVLAALNIAYRASSAAGQGTYQAVLQAQTYGNVQLAMQELASEWSTSTKEETRPQQWFYAIKAGDPRGDLVEVSLLARTPQSAQMGGYAQIDRTLSWRDGDWKMQVPAPRLTLATSTQGYTPLN